MAVTYAVDAEEMGLRVADSGEEKISPALQVDDAQNRIMKSGLRISEQV
jgi:hypothetical protein